MSTALVPTSETIARWSELPMPVFPWRDPQTVSRTDLSAYIGELERACEANPASPMLWTCLGMAYAVNYDVMKSMDALETASEVDPTHFWARLKCGELHYRLRTLDCAEDETLKAVELAEDTIQLAMAQKQLRDIRALNPPVRRRRPPSMTGRAVFLSTLMLFAYLAVAWG